MIRHSICRQGLHRPLDKYHVQINISTQGEPEENGFTARLLRTFREGDEDLTEYNDFGDVRAQIGRFREEVYMTKHIHSSLKVFDTR